MPAHTKTPPPPWATRSTTLTSANRSPTHAVCHLPCTDKPRFIHEENTSPKCQTPSNVNICPLKSVTMTNCSQVETLMRTKSMRMSFPEMVSDSLCRNSLIMQTDCCSSCLWGGWSQTILEVKMLDGEVLGWCGYTWSAVVRPVGCTPKFSEILWRWLMVDKSKLNSRATALVDILAVSMPIAHSFKTCNICGIVLCDKTAHFWVAFSCGQPKAHLWDNHAV